MPVFRSVTKAGLDVRLGDEFGRQAKNQTGQPIAAFRVCAWEDDNSIVLASAVGANTSDIAGVTTAAIPNLQKGLVQRIGRVKNALAGLGAIAGQSIFLSETPGELTLIAPTVINSSIIRVGTAEPSDDSLITEAADLLLNIDIISEG
jgi:hypothetical protein